jgi:hypothetical protein
MKILVLLALILISPLTAGPQEHLTLAAGQEVRLRFSPDQITEVALQTSAQAGVAVRVERVTDRSFVRGFGMSKSSKEKVLVEGDAVLVLINESKSPVDLQYQTSQGTTAQAKDSDGVKLTFHNGSLASIPLIIPGVMNPNLSPLSDSGVTLGYGQKVFFKEKGKQYLLFEIDETFKDGDQLEIQDMIKARKKELGI